MMGLGILGRISMRRLWRGGATITDLKTEEQLAPSLKKLKKFTDIKRVCFRSARFGLFFRQRHGIKPPACRLILYMCRSQKNNFLIEIGCVSFRQLISTWTLNVQVVGLPNERKITVTHLIYEKMKRGF